MLKKIPWRHSNSSVENAPVESCFCLPGKVSTEKKSRGLFDNSDQCAYCFNIGHWKKDCPVLKAKLNRSKLEPKSGLAAASVVEVGVNTFQGNSGLGVEEKLGYAPFVTDGLVSLVGSDEKVSVKILRDTGASETFILESVLPFSENSCTGNKVLIKGIELQVLSVPLHTVELVRLW